MTYDIYIYIYINVIFSIMAKKVYKKQISQRPIPSVVKYLR